MSPTLCCLFVSIIKTPQGHRPASTSQCQVPLNQRTSWKCHWHVWKLIGYVSCVITRRTDKNQSRARIFFWPRLQRANSNDTLLLLLDIYMWQSRLSFMSDIWEKTLDSVTINSMSWGSVNIFTGLNGDALSDTKPDVFAFFVCSVGTFVSPMD